MPAQPFIVVYGHDPSLLDTRTWVLQGAGYRAQQASQLSEVAQATDQQTVDLVILCHTLSAEECQAIRRALDALRPSVQRLLITANRPLSHFAAGEPTISAFDGPRALLDLVQRLLTASNDRA